MTSTSDGALAGLSGAVRSAVAWLRRKLTGAPGPDEGAQGEPVHRWQLAAHGGLLVAAAALRLWDLGSRAMHHDESLHAYYAYNLSSGVGYRHDPMMHGPFQMEATAAVFFTLGDSDFTARLVYALAGIALVGLPFLFRARLGNLGAVFVSALLAFSPAMVYFSRFARNDILMALWTLGLVIAIWRYIDEGKNRYLYVAAALLALSFATKETAYIVTFTLGAYLGLVVTIRNWPAIRRGIVVGEVSPPAALLRIAVGALEAARRGLRLSGTSRPAGLLVLLVTLSLPLGSALIGSFHDTSLMSSTGLVLVSPGPCASKVIFDVELSKCPEAEEWYNPAELDDRYEQAFYGGILDGPIGAPEGGGVVIAALIILGLAWISAAMGTKWAGRVWWLCAAIFYAIIVLLYSTFFTNLDGIGSGMWRSLGYWLAQQEVARGGQPLYYYLIITPVYEFLPLVLSVAGAVYYLRRRDGFGLFLAFWAVTTFLVYTIASEKMPWLLVNITLPLVVLGGKFMADVVAGIQWGRIGYAGWALGVIGAPAFLLLSWKLAFSGLDGMGPGEVLLMLGSAAAMAALAVAAWLYSRGSGFRNLASLAGLSLVAILLALSIRTGWIASFRNGDTPVEMIVYTQTSPDIVRTLRNVEKAGLDSGAQTTIPVTIDNTSGFTWPWAWYLRDYSKLSYSSFDDQPLPLVSNASVLLIHEKNRSPSVDRLSEIFGEGERIKHRWWFPESYRGLTLRKFLGALVDRRSWRSHMDYFLYRRLSQDIGSEDAYVYFAPST